MTKRDLLTQLESFDDNAEVAYHETTWIGIEDPSLSFTFVKPIHEVRLYNRCILLCEGPVLTNLGVCYESWE